MSRFDTTYTASIQFYKDPIDISCECGNCDWKGAADTLAPIEDCILTPGDPSPAGRCPECDSLAYVVKL